MGMVYFGVELLFSIEVALTVPILLKLKVPETYLNKNIFLKLLLIEFELKTIIKSIKDIFVCLLCKPFNRVYFSTSIGYYERSMSECTWSAQAIHSCSFNFVFHWNNSYFKWNIFWSVAWRFEARCNYM